VEDTRVGSVAGTVPGVVGRAAEVTATAVVETVMVGAEKAPVVAAATVMVVKDLEEVVLMDLAVAVAVMVVAVKVRAVVETATEEVEEVGERAMVATAMVGAEKAMAVAVMAVAVKVMAAVGKATEEVGEAVGTAAAHT